ncbi:MAG: thiamine-phosphate kinase [Saccharospirillaceae bacterium]|nr:thiamine-phosphate kinase [Saccharospirillaceae bacterium]
MPPAGCDLLQSIDTQVADVHFPATAPARLIAQRALRCAASDLAAMGAEPQGFHLALTLPDAEHEWLADFASGLRDAAHTLDLDLLGGDTTSGPCLVITIQVQGWAPAGAALIRAGAQAGDDIWVSDTIGCGALALPQVLENPAQFSGLARHYYFPQVQMPLGIKLRNLATSCMDISDGLLQDAGHIARASGVTLEFDAATIPTMAERTDRRWLQCLTGGDDYQLLFTVPAARRKDAEALREEFSGIARIGKVIAHNGEDVVLQDEGRPLELPQHNGYQHF